MYLKSFKLKLFVIMFLCVFTFVQITTPVIQSRAFAADIIIGGGSFIALETAIAWALGALGFAAASATVYEHRDKLKAWGGEMLDKFENFCESAANKLAVTAKDARDWVQDIAEGTLKKASLTYDAFKTWAVTMAYTPNTGLLPLDQVHYDISKTFVVSPNVFTAGQFYADWSSDLMRYVNYSYISWDGNQSLSTNTKCLSVQLHYKLDGWSFGDVLNYLVSMQPFEYIYTYQTGYSPTKFSGTYSASKIVAGNHTVYVSRPFPSQSSYGAEQFAPSYGNNITWYRVDVGTYPQIGFTDGEIRLVANAYLDYMNLLDGVGTGTNTDTKNSIIIRDSVQDILDRDAGVLDNLDIVNPTIPGVTTVPGVVTLPWDRVGVLAPDGTLDLPLDSTGTLVTDIPITLPVDTVTDKVVGTDLTVDDVVTVPDVNVSDTNLSDYTITGLESFFPFCLPFDFINFLNVLNADPQAPVFEWEMTFLKNLGFKSYTIVIDLSPYNSVATIFRNMQLLLFIVGLILTTRSKFIRG